MPAPFHALVATPERIVFDSDVSSVIVPALEGYLGILAHHAPLMALLAPGSVTLRDPAGRTQIINSTGSGILEVSQNKAVLLLDSVGSPS